MSRIEDFNSQLPKCEKPGCGKPVGSHIHLTKEDRDAMEAWASEGQRHAEMDKFMRTAPTDVRDHAALKAHMLSSGHYAHPMDVHEMTHAELKAHHDEDHAKMDAGPAVERENYTNFGFEHFHNA
jgi:hypothetical protein